MQITEMLQVLSNTNTAVPAVRVQYDDARQFKNYAKQLGIMDDLKVRPTRPN